MARQHNANETSPRQGGETPVLEEIRHRKKMRKARRFVVLVVVLAALLAWITGLFGASLTAAGDLVDTVRIAMTRGGGYPVQTGITELYQLEPVTGGFLALGSESCVLYTDNGARLRNIQPGYARPAIAAGKTRFLIYNRGGNELRVESRTQTLYTQTLNNNILQCAMASNGTFAAAAMGTGYTADVTVYSGTMEKLLGWSMTDSEGIPLRMAFAGDNCRLAVATLLTREGQVAAGLYLLDSARNTETMLAEYTGGVPLEVCWLSGSRLLVIYDTQAVVYAASDGAVQASYSYGGRNLAAHALCTNGSLALLLDDGTAQQLVLLDDALALRAQAEVSGGTGLLHTRTAVYLCTESAVECYSLQGEYQWEQVCAAPPQALLEAGQLLVFCGSEAAVCAPDSGKS